jgi:dienelactone hydrolase
VENAPPELVEDSRIRSVSVPTITPYLPPKEKRTGMAIIVCAGGGYGSHDWRTHVVNAAQVFNPKGVTVIGLKYRTRPPNGKTNEDIQTVTLLDAQRAVRTVRARAAGWGLDPRQIGVAGYSAGANLAMNLAANFDAGDANATDPVERQSSRPDFAVGCATWHWRQKESPFKFPKHAPPVFLVHATNDGLPGPDGRLGGAPIECRAPSALIWRSSACPCGCWSSTKARTVSATCFRSACKAAFRPRNGRTCC